MTVSANPFAGLRPALETLATEGRVLPATGQAMEELMRPDHEEVLDTLRLGDEQVLDTMYELGNAAPYVELEPLHRTIDHPLRFFLDGSARTFFLGDVVEGNRRSPIHVSQIGSAVVRRAADGRVQVARSRHRILLMLDKSGLSFADEIERLVKEAGDRFGFVDLMERDPDTDATSGKEPRSRAAHKAHHQMAALEEELGRELQREHGEWLVLDGSLGKDLHSWRDVEEFLGVTKSFSRNPMFKLPGARRSSTVNLFNLLAGLPASGRTAVFAARSGAVAVWYVRLREQRHLDYPLMGVVKVELPRPDHSPVPSDLVDRISSAIIAERQSTPHGRDVRWHAHLYAIFLAEQAVKNGFVSSEVLKAGLRWPELARGG